MSYSYSFQCYITAGYLNRIVLVTSPLKQAVSGYFRNFWDVTLTAAYLPDQHDYFVTGKPYEQYARRPQYGYLRLNGSSDSRKRLLFNYDISGFRFF